MILDNDLYVIDWMEFIEISKERNWKLSGTLTKIENSLTEIRGKQYSIEVMKRIKMRV